MRKGFLWFSIHLRKYNQRLFAPNTWKNNILATLQSVCLQKMLWNVCFVIHVYVQFLIDLKSRFTWEFFYFLSIYTNVWISFMFFNLSVKNTFYHFTLHRRCGGGEINNKLLFCRTNAFPWLFEKKLLKCFCLF